MSARLLRIAAIVLATCVLMANVAVAQQLSANVVMKVSKAAQDSIVNEGEDLTISVSVDGAASYLWYRGGEAITGANHAAYTIASATVQDADTYRVDAFGEDGGMLMSMEFPVRVVEKALPKSGDDTLSVGALAAIMCAAGAVLCAIFVVRKRKAAA